MTAAACASFSDASSSPAAWMIFARFSRSASACRAIARCMSGGRSTCFTSTADTLMPHGSVCWSRICCSCWFSCSRSRQQVVELHLAEHAAQRRLRELRRRVVVVLDLDDRPARIHHAEVDDRVDLHRHVVARDDVLRRHVHDDRAQADADHAIDRREDEDDARALRLRQQLAEPEDDAALVLVQDLDRAEQVERRR